MMMNDLSISVNTLNGDSNDRIRFEMAIHEIYMARNLVGQFIMIKNVILETYNYPLMKVKMVVKLKGIEILHIDIKNGRNLLGDYPLEYKEVQKILIRRIKEYNLIARDKAKLKDEH